MPNYTLKSLLQDTTTDVRELVEAKLELLQLKLADKGASAAAGGVYGFLLYVVAKLSITFLLISGGFAFSLIFIENPQVLEFLKALLFGFLCITGVLVLILLITLAIKKNLQENVKAKVINEVLDQLEEQERQKETELLINSVSATMNSSEATAAETEITNQINE